MPRRPDPDEVPLNYQYGCSKVIEVQRADGSSFRTYISIKNLSPCSNWIPDPSTGGCKEKKLNKGPCQECVEEPNIIRTGGQPGYTIPSTVGRKAKWQPVFPNACITTVFNGECIEVACPGASICKFLDGKYECVFDCESSERYCNNCEECVGTSKRKGNQGCVSKCGPGMVCGGAGNLPEDDPLNKSAGQCVCIYYAHGETAPSGAYYDDVATQECPENLPDVRSVPNQSGAPNAIDGCECYCDAIETCEFPDVFNDEDCSCTPYDAEGLNIDLLP